MGSVPGLGRSPGGGYGNPLQFSCLENPMDRGGWQGTVRRVTKHPHDWQLSTNVLAQWYRSIISREVWENCPHAPMSVS